MQLIGANVVAAANFFNPSVFSQLWLIENEIVARDAFLPGSVFTDQLVSVMASTFQLLIIPQQVQFVPRCPPEEEVALVADKVGRIVTTLPHTPFQAIGLNFIWQVLPADGELVQLERRLFFSNESALHRLFDAPDARFGGYLSRDVLGCRLRLSVEPTLSPGPEPSEGLQFTFNFNQNLAAPGRAAVAEIQRMLGQWAAAKAETQRTMDSVLQQA